VPTSIGEVLLFDDRASRSSGGELVGAGAAPLGGLAAGTVWATDLLALSPAVEPCDLASLKERYARFPEELARSSGWFGGGAEG